MPKAPSGIAEYHVQPGESCLVEGPALLCTLLGSCVGITFWNPRRAVAGLCHPMLPTLPRPGAPPDPSSVQRYVDSSIRDMIARLEGLGAARRETEVKLFGGADVLQSSATRASVGRLNAETAARILHAENLNVIAASTRGHVGMQIRFHTGTGEVLLRRFGPCGPSRGPAPSGGSHDAAYEDPRPDRR